MKYERILVGLHVWLQWLPVTIRLGKGYPDGCSIPKIGESYLLCERDFLSQTKQHS